MICIHMLCFQDERKRKIPLPSILVSLNASTLLEAGIVRGCGWQHIGAFVNLGAYDLVAAPIAVLLCFVAHLRAKGLWIGILTGTTVQATSYVVITALINWKKQVLASIPLLHIFLFQLRLPHPGNLFSYNNAVFWSLRYLCCKQMEVGRSHRD